MESFPPEMRASTFILRNNNTAIDIIIPPMNDDNELEDIQEEHPRMEESIAFSEKPPETGTEQKIAEVVLGQPEHEQRIMIAIEGRETRGSMLTKHTVYQIRGNDERGSFMVWRRYNQFFELRAAMVKTWPGCMIPSLPGKNPLTKNQEDLIMKRERTLDDFLKQMTLRKYLYYSDEFQTLLRSQEGDVSSVMAKWGVPPPSVIIKRYRELFSELEGREITPNLVEDIFTFAKMLQGNAEVLEDYRKRAKELAFVKDRQNKYYHDFFKIMKQYEANLLSQYATQPQLLYLNPQFEKLRSHQDSIADLTRRNPFWWLYDVIKNQERDVRAFGELIKSIEHYGIRGKELQNKIESNMRGIGDAAGGKKNMRTLAMKGTTDEIKYKLQVQNDKLKQEMEDHEILRDILLGVVAYVEIKEYKENKRQFYCNLLQSVATIELNMAETASSIWGEMQESLSDLVEKYA